MKYIIILVSIILILFAGCVGPERISSKKACDMVYAIERADTVVFIHDVLWHGRQVKMLRINYYDADNRLILFYQTPDSVECYRCVEKSPYPRCGCIKYEKYFKTAKVYEMFNYRRFYEGWFKPEEEK